MQELLKSIAQFSTAQLLTTLAILTPFVGAIWVAMKWAYETRLQNLETTLADLRADFARRLERDLAKVTDVHEIERVALQAELDVAQAKAASLRADIDRLINNFERSRVATKARADELANAQHDLALLLEQLVGPSELHPKYVEYLCAYPTLISKVSFSEAQVASLRNGADQGFGNSMYVYGRMLITGRMLRDGLLAPDKEQGLALIRSAAEKGHVPSKAFAL